jgi:hypothetical protein
MQRLPASPDLEQLKTRAKELLRAVRACDPAALESIAWLGERTAFSLATAQFVVARGFGFASWARLKAYVSVLSKSVKTTNHRQRIRALTVELLELARTRDFETLAARLAIPLRDILELRAELVALRLHGAFVDALLEGLQHPAPPVRFNCAGALDHLADDRCASALERLLGDPVPRVRRAALHSLACDACKIAPLPGRDDLVPKLIALATDDPNARVRSAAFNALVLSCDPRAQATVRAGLETERNAGRQRYLRRNLNATHAP